MSRQRREMCLQVRLQKTHYVGLLGSTLLVRSVRGLVQGTFPLRPAELSEHPSTYPTSSCAAQHP
eukprot:10666865-Alexandrium_andersonii.AAC.1